MIQGGDPTGTGKGGQSIWGKPFKDELNSKLLHSGRGIVSMANSGPHTNGSQFFILYKSANHLNFKHTVFGMVVGGLTALAAMEKVPIDDDDRPMVSNILQHSSLFCFSLYIFSLKIKMYYLFFCYLLFEVTLCIIYVSVRGATHSTYSQTLHMLLFSLELRCLNLFNICEFHYKSITSE